MKNYHLHFCFKISLMLPWKLMSTVSYLKPHLQPCQCQKKVWALFKCLFCFLLAKLCTVLQCRNCHMKTLEAFKMLYFFKLAVFTVTWASNTYSILFHVCKDQVWNHKMWQMFGECLCNFVTMCSYILIKTSSVMKSDISALSPKSAKKKDVANMMEIWHFFV